MEVAAAACSSLAVTGEQPLFQILPPADSEFLKGPVYVALNRPHGEEEPFGDFGVPVALNNQGGDVPFPPGQQRRSGMQGVGRGVPVLFVEQLLDPLKQRLVAAGPGNPERFIAAPVGYAAPSGSTFPAPKRRSSSMSSSRKARASRPAA